jgi:CubicO group peptidase (beta-lactamase class C family)
MTSMLVAIEVYRGLFGWDAPVREITPVYQFPEPELTNNSTVRQLMGMGTGLAESPIELYLDLTSPRNFLDTLATLPVKYPPFTAYFYNNYVYSTAAYLSFLQEGLPFCAGLEERYAREMKRELFDLMGMPTSAITDDPRTVSSNVSRSYGYDLRFGIKPNQVLPYLSIRMVSPAGGSWHAALWRRPGRVRRQCHRRRIRWASHTAWAGYHLPPTACSIFGTTAAWTGSRRT